MTCKRARGALARYVRADRQTQAERGRGTYVEEDGLARLGVLARRRRLLRLSRAQVGHARRSRLLHRLLHLLLLLLLLLSERALVDLRRRLLR